MLRFSPVFGLSRSVAHVSFHFLHVIFPRGGFRFGEFIRCMPKSRTMRQPPAGSEPYAGCRQPARGSKPCAGCRQPAHGFLPARFHTCLSAHRFCPHFSACTLLSVLSYLYFYNYIFLFVFSYLRFSACTFPLALFHSFFSVHAFPSVLPAQKQNANPKTKHPAQRQNAGPKTERQTRRNTGMVSRGAGQTIVVPPS